ncbi:ion transporter [Limosilactobacillus kribbianus]|uniref:ion transporter n=1 Tax=Limosilactobacillus kribbianus TaxID=2982695 RepID=UPI00226438B4|nr:ion transporter [Limosilactobacillus kribbianus]
MNKRKLSITYNTVMAILAVISIVLIVLDYAKEIKITAMPYNVIDNGILIIFAVDYFSRLALAKNKWEFFKNNIFDLLSIIPATEVSSFFRIARIGRLLRLLKVLRILRLVGLAGRLEKFLKINGLLYYLYTSLVVALITSSLYCVSEKVSFPTALWWSIVTSTTVGYGDISPTTLVGKLAAVINMLIGIGLVGMLTSSITGYFTKSSGDDIEELKQQNEQLKEKLNEIEELIKERNN